MEERDVAAARAVVQSLGEQLQHAPTFRHLDSRARAGLLRDLSTIGDALQPDELSRALDLPPPRRLPFGTTGTSVPDSTVGQPAAPAPAETGPTAKAATEAIGSRLGGLVDEVGFNTFVAGLVHGTWDALVDASIRQMEAFADLVRAVAKDVEDFTAENVSLDQARDHLVAGHPQDLVVQPATADTPAALRARPRPDDEPSSPSWLSDYGLAGQDLDDDMIEGQLVPAARRTLGENRMQLLATMVLLGMNRIVVRDGTIAAKVRFRAQAHDTTQVQVAQGQPTWGDRGSATTQTHDMFVSTVGVNVQADADLRAELFGEVQITFATETVPLERFVEPARMSLVQRNSRTAPPPAPTAAVPPVPPPAAAIAAPATTPGSGTADVPASPPVRVIEGP